MCRVDIEGTTERNRQAPEILAWKNYHLEVLVEMYKFKQLQPCIMQSSLGMHRHDICQKNYATAVLGARILRKKCVNRDISQFATKERKCFKMA